MDLLRWFRFLWAAGIGWDQATRAEARDFCRWIQLAAKAAPGAPRTGGARVRRGGKEAVNPVTGKPALAVTYAAATRAHSESVLRAFYDLHLEAGTGPMVNPFPLSRGRRGGRVNAHHNPAEPYRDERSGRYRPAVVQRMPRCIPDKKFDQLFSALPSNRDRALVAFWVFWLRLYQAQMEGLVPAGRDQPLWWTLLRPFRRLAYHGAEAMFARANATLGANWTLHDLRHTAAYRMARDPGLPVTDVQWILGHAHLSTTQRYLNPLTEDVIADVLAFHGRRGQAGLARPGPVAGYRPGSLRNLFGEDAL